MSNSILWQGCFLVWVVPALEPGLARACFGDLMVVILAFCTEYKDNASQ